MSVAGFQFLIRSAVFGTAAIFQARTWVMQGSTQWQQVAEN